MTPAQETHLRALAALCAGYNGSVSAEELNATIHDGRRQTLGSTVRVLTGLIAHGYATSGWNADIENTGYWVTKAGRKALETT